MRLRALALAAASALASALAALGAVAQAPDDEAHAGATPDFPFPADLAHALDRPPLPGEQASESELAAWVAVEEERYIDAREAAERILRRDPTSYVAEAVLGFVQHYGEGNYPRAVYHLERALREFERQHGSTPDPDGPWLWHARLLRELAFANGDLERYDDKLGYLDRHDTLYDPDMVAERAWPLMKLRRYDDARAAAELGLALDRPMQTLLALNALCAIEFEAGNDGASYDACARAVEHARTRGGPNAVDLTNFAEASRSLFKLDEAERTLLEATEAPVAWYGNPWLELGALYLREGRFAESLDALRRVRGYRARRPPHVQEVDRNEGRRELAAFFLAVGRPDDALRITEQALVLPDRRGHNSRDPAQDEALVALFDRRARLVSAERVLERASTESWWRRPAAWLEAWTLRVEAWASGRRAARLMADDARLVGSFRIGTSKGAIMPPWFAGELVEVLGPGVVHEAVERARARDRRPGADAYYDAFEAEAAFRAGDLEGARRLATAAREALGPGEALLRARVDAVAAAAAKRAGAHEEALARFESAFQVDPGVLRRLDLEVPVRIEWAGGEVAARAAAILAGSPRLTRDGEGLRLRVESDGLGGRACLLDRSDGVLGCGEAEAEAEEDTADIARAVARAFHAQVFAPKVDLSQADVSGLDGTTVTGGDALDAVLDSGGAPEG